MYLLPKITEHKILFHIISNARQCGAFISDVFKHTSQSKIFIYLL